MKKRLLILLILTINLNAELFIKKNNIKQQISYVEESNKYIVSRNNIFDANTNIMIKYNDKDIELIKSFEEKHNLKLESVLRIGYYIYSSDTNIIDKINEIIDDDNIKTVFPAWKKTVISR